jgi:hypothetical protein
MVGTVTGSQEWAPAPLKTRSLVWRWVFLATGALWSLAFATFIFSYHIDEPRGMLTITTGGRTFTGNPPALTLYERSGVVWVIALFIVGFVILCGTADLLYRTVRRLIGPGLVAIVAGGLLVAYSLFGLLYGLLGVGTIGALVILAGLPMRTSQTEAGPVPISGH